MDKLQAALTAIRELIEAEPDPFGRVVLIQSVRAHLHGLSPLAGAPVDYVRWIPIAQVTPNDYNPNSVAKVEMGLLHKSISHDGYTQPVVTVVAKKCETHLPCGHLLSVDSDKDKQESPLWITLPSHPSDLLLTRLWDIPLECWTGKEVSLGCTGKNTLDGGAGSEFRCLNLSATTVKTCANGSGISGGSEGFTTPSDCARSTSGTSPESTTSCCCSTLVCPTCALSDPERKKSWSFYTVKAKGSAAGCGLLLNCVLSESQDQKYQRSNWPPDSAEVLTPSAPSETNLESSHRSGISGRRLLVTNLSRACIVDGFHRYYTMLTNQDIYDRFLGLLPVVVLNKGINDRMASTVRHNRARGKHSVQGMSAMVFKMLDGGWADDAICNELGMSPEELLRLKHVTGFSKLFKDAEYQKAWVTKRQVMVGKEYRDSHPTAPPAG